MGCSADCDGAFVGDGVACVFEEVVFFDSEVCAEKCGDSDDGEDDKN